jgi:hypothetical protein
MQAYPFSISQLFGINRRYVVPLFQRQYVWSAQKQWQPLWDDIIEQAERALAQEADHSQTSRGHFLGAVVISPLPFSGLQVPPMEVIDGQQRITTLQILLAALRDYAIQNHLDNVRQAVAQITENTGMREQELERYKVWPTISDRSAFEAVMAAGSAETLEKKYPLQRIKRTQRYYPRPRLVEAYLFFAQAIQAFLAETAVSDDTAVEETDADETLPELAPDELELAPQTSSPATNPVNQEEVTRRLYALLQVLSNRVQIVVIQLDESDDPQVIFETLNARGEPLLPSDLIRNFLFLSAARQKADVPHLYTNYWQPFDQLDAAGGFDWKQETRQGRFSRPLIDLFFFHYLTYQRGQDLLMNHIFQTYRAWWQARKPTPTVEQELKTIQHFGAIFKDFFDGGATTRIEIFARRARILDTSTVYPLLLLLAGEPGKVAEGEFSGILTDVESYLVRRMVCGLTTKNYNRVFLSILAKLKEAPTITRALIRELLLEQQGPAVSWPDDKTFRSAWLNRPIYQELTAPRVVMVLEALEWQQYGSKQERAPFTEANYSVEHILPQNPVEHVWPLSVPAEADTATREAAWEERQRLTHTIGNLTLVTGALNASLSNSAFNTKLKMYDDSVLMLNKYFRKNEQTTWNEASINERGRRLFNVACEIWPYPA